jgi:hypothetical protein
LARAGETVKVDVNLHNSAGVALEGVSFQLYDVTSTFEKYKVEDVEGSARLDNFLADFETGKITTAEFILEENWRQTDASGNLSYTLDNTRARLFLLLAASGTVNVVPSLFGLPTNELALTIEPKIEETTEVEHLDIYFQKRGITQTGTDLGVLAGAEFVFYKVENGVKMYYQNGGIFTADMNDAVKYISQANGRVEVRDTEGVVDGTYYFTETKAPDGFAIRQDATEIPVVVRDGVATVAEEAPQNAIVYNESITTPPVEEEGVLPRTIEPQPIPTTYEDSGEMPRTYELLATGEKILDWIVRYGMILVVLSLAGFSWSMYRRQARVKSVRANVRKHGRK